MRHADVPDMRNAVAVAIAIASTAGLAGGCSSDPAPDQALAAFEAFQDALQRGDRSACRQLLTAESADALREVPWNDVQRRRALQPLGVHRMNQEWLVRVADPNDGGSESHFVVVREYGRMVVDLVATAGQHTRAVEAAAGGERFEPRELTPADFERIRQHELATPPR